MRATGDAPVTAANAGSAPVVHLGVIDERICAQVGSRPTLAGHGKALAPATRAFGSAEARRGGIHRAFASANTTLTRQIEGGGREGRC